MMNRRGLGRLAAMAVVAGAAMVSAGCGSAYWTHRGQDFTDIWELGLTGSDKSQFALYGGLTHGLMIGQSSLHGRLYGLANSKWGVHELVDDSWAWPILGEDVHEVATGESLPPDVELPKYETGVLGLVFGERVAPAYKAFNCPLIIHLGRGGVMINTKGAEALDFLFGWFGVDILKDDTGERPVVARRD